MYPRQKLHSIIWNCKVANHRRGEFLDIITCVIYITVALVYMMPEWHKDYRAWMSTAVWWAQPPGKCSDALWKCCSWIGKIAILLPCSEISLTSHQRAPSFSIGLSFQPVFRYQLAVTDAGRRLPLKKKYKKLLGRKNLWQTNDLSNHPLMFWIPFPDTFHEIAY